MNARLGFSIAAHLEPEVMIIDEVLSVGDMAFQERCIERMRSFKRTGVTIVFVSHNLQAVTELCDRALYLKRQVKALGTAAEVIDAYVRDSFVGGGHSHSDGEVHIVSTALTHATGEPVGRNVDAGEHLCFRVVLEAARPVAGMSFAFRLIRATNQLLAYDGQFSQAELEIPTDRAGRFSLDFHFDANLTRGQYYIDLLIGQPPTTRQLARLTPAAHLSVGETRTWGGVANLMTRVTVGTIQESPAAVNA
ncbi:MAG: Wzt carbohydrate-binding domain-containing protein [Vicinamibacterales bacterium]